MPKISSNKDSRYAIRGRIVTMNQQRSVIPRGYLYLEDDTIRHVLPESAPAPAGWSKTGAVSVRGTIYPGMIELHNHLAYNIIPLWDVPKKFRHRDLWRNHPDYKKKMTGPIRTLGHLDGYLQAIVRFTECKLVFGGVTTSQGITLSSHGKIQSMFMGMVRNVEKPEIPGVLPAKTRIADVKDPVSFQRNIDRANPNLLHLAEGSQEAANKHFKALNFEGTNKWAINEKLIGIHATGLYPEDFKIMGDRGGKVIWSPTSNLLLYGLTTDVVAAKEHNVSLSIGSDWSPSGSKNLLCELKVAKLFSEKNGGVFTDQELVEMVTINPAQALGWDNHLGSLEAGKKADFFVVSGYSGDPYAKLLKATERHLNLVTIGGIPHFGLNVLMKRFTGKTEKIGIKQYRRGLHIPAPPANNPIAVTTSFSDAQKLLTEGLKNLPALAVQVENTNSAFALGAMESSAQGVPTGTRWVIGDHHEDEVHEFENFDLAGVPFSEIAEPIQLDRKTVLEDDLFFKRLALNPNIADHFKTELPPYYGRKIDLDQSALYRLEVDQAEKKAGKGGQSLARFRREKGYLTRLEKHMILDRCCTVLSEFYVHLHQKSTLYASDPLAKFEIIRSQIPKEGEDDVRSELDFHQQIISVFNSVRDLHTVYRLPMPYAHKIAYLPFFVEACWKKSGNRKFIVTRTIGSKHGKYFREGVEVVSWNGIPIERAVTLNGERFAGSNSSAAFARGLNSLTFRPLSVMLPPEEEWVHLTFRTKDGNEHTRKFSWWVDHQTSAPNPTSFDKTSFAAGYDFQASNVQEIKKNFFAVKAAGKESVKHGKKYLSTTEYHSFKAKKIEDDIGYIRIYSFQTNQPLAFAQEFQRLISELGTSKLILDIRNNPGGHIHAAEFMLQALSKANIEPQSAQFIATQSVVTLCDLHAAASPIIDLSAWNRTLPSLRSTGAQFSAAHPISPLKALKKFRAKQAFKCVLITDALCYSASDIFASGFQDNNIGELLGVDGNTGAGGANVWSLNQLHYLTQGAPELAESLAPLPYGADIKVAVRRTLRTGNNHGVPLEDLGVTLDDRHWMTRNDVLHKNVDLIAKATEMLEGKSKKVRHGNLKRERKGRTIGHK